jgi:hypothetical protein
MPAEGITACATLIRSMKRLSFSLLVPLFFLAATAHASTLFYTGTLVGSGTFNSNPFTDATVTFFASADTASITTSSGGLVYSIPGPVTVTVSGLGSDLLVPSGGGLVINTGAGSITAVNFGASTDPNAPANFGFFAPVAGYANAPFGPVQSTGYFGSHDITGSGGSISVTSSGATTFEVTFATPEPATVFSAGACLAGLTLALLYRRRT